MVLGFGTSGWHVRAALDPATSLGTLWLRPPRRRQSVAFGGQNNRAVSAVDGERIMSMFVGEALVGEGNEIAHIDLLIGSKDGPVGSAFANALARQSEGHTNLLAVLTPNLAVKPATVLVTKVTIKGMKQAVQMFRSEEHTSELQ